MAAPSSRRRFEALTANLPGMVFQMEYRDGRLALLYVSEGSYRLLGVAPQELLEQPSLFFDSVAEGGTAQLKDMLIEAAATRPYVEWEREWHPGSADDARSIEIAARSRRLDSDVILWDGIVTDVTSIKAAEQDLRELASHLTRAREEEREALARELHDDIGSALTVVKFEVAWLKNASHDVPAIAAKLGDIDRLIDAAILATGRITHDLRPGIIDEGIVASLEWQTRTFEQRMGIACSFQASREDIALERDSALAMFRVCQEALNNIAKHARATRVEVRLDATDDALMLEIHDNGKGITAVDMAKPSCFGLRGMKERAGALGGEIEIRSAADGGTTVAFTLFTDTLAAQALAIDER